jgi:hypothetical protein
VFGPDTRGPTGAVRPVLLPSSCVQGLSVHLKKDKRITSRIGSGELCGQVPEGRQGEGHMTQNERNDQHKRTRNFCSRSFANLISCLTPCGWNSPLLPGLGHVRLVEPHHSLPGIFLVCSVQFLGDKSEKSCTIANQLDQCIWNGGWNNAHLLVVDVVA